MCISYLQFSATLVMHLIALKWISGLVDVRMSSRSISSPSFFWISSTLSLSLRQLENTFKASTWRSLSSCKDKNKSKPCFLHQVSSQFELRTMLLKCILPHIRTALLRTLINFSSPLSSLKVTSVFSSALTFSSVFKTKFWITGNSEFSSSRSGRIAPRLWTSWRLAWSFQRHVITQDTI